MVECHLTLDGRIYRRYGSLLLAPGQQVYAAHYPEFTATLLILLREMRTGVRPVGFDD